VRVCVCVCVFLWAAMLCAGAVCGSVGRVTMIIAAFLAIGGDQPQVCECPTWATITWTPPMAGYVTVQNSYQRERVARSGYRRHVLIGKGTPTRSKDRCRARPLTVKTVKYVLGQNWSRNNDFNDFNVFIFFVSCPGVNTTCETCTPSVGKRGWVSIGCCSCSCSC